MTANFPLIVRHKELVLKLYNWMDYPPGKAMRNVEAFDLLGSKLWEIEALGGYAESNFYTSISSTDGGIHAFNFQCHDCVIDEITGKILSSSFTK
jgi:hypothetical protein